MATSTKRLRRLWDAYAFPDFRPQPTVRGIFGDPKGRIINDQEVSPRELLQVRASKAAVLSRLSSHPGRDDGVWKVATNIR